MDLKSKSHLYLVITLLSGSLLPVLLALAKGVDLYELMLFIFTLSVPTSLLLVKARGEQKDLLDTFRDRKKVALMVLTSLVVFFPIEFGIAIAEHYISASLTTAIFRTSPLLMLLLLPYMLRERLTRYQIAALVLGFVGLYIGVSNGNLTGILQNSNISIIAFMILMAFGYALSIVMIKKYLFKLSVLLFVAAVTMFALSSILFFASGTQLQTLSYLQLFIVFYIGMFFNVIGFYMYFYMLKPLKATLVTNVYMLSPFITFLLAITILGEAIQPYYLAIAGFVGAGILIQSFDKKGSTYAARSKDEGINRMTIFDVTGVFANTGEVALNDTIRDGGRILAVKLPGQYAANVNSMVNGVKYSNVYTDAHKSITEESKFVKDIVGAGAGEFVVMKAGLLDDCEKFFEDLQGRIRTSKEEQEKEVEGSAG